MKNSKMSLALIGGLLGLAVAGAATYVLISNEELRDSIREKFLQTSRASRDRMDAMTEEVVLRKAKLTRNPSVNQDWVEQQWSSIGY